MSKSPEVGAGVAVECLGDGQSEQAVGERDDARVERDVEHCADVVADVLVEVDGADVAEEGALFVGVVVVHLLRGIAAGLRDRGDHRRLDVHAVGISVVDVRTDIGVGHGRIGTQVRLVVRATARSSVATSRAFASTIGTFAVAFASTVGALAVAFAVTVGAFAATILPLAATVVALTARAVALGEHGRELPRGYLEVAEADHAGA